MRCRSLAGQRRRPRRGTEERARGGDSAVERLLIECSGASPSARVTLIGKKRTHVGSHDSSGTRTKNHILGHSLRIKSLEKLQFAHRNLYNRGEPPAQENQFSHPPSNLAIPLEQEANANTNPDRLDSRRNDMLLPSERRASWETAKGRRGNERKVGGKRGVAIPDLLSDQRGRLRSYAAARVRIIRLPKKRPKRARRDETNLEFGRRRAAQFLDLRLAVVKVERRRHLDSRVHRHVLWARTGVRARSRGKRKARETHLLVANVDAVKVNTLPPLVPGQVFPLGRDALAASIGAVRSTSLERRETVAAPSKCGARLGLTRTLPTARRIQSPSSPVPTAARRFRVIVSRGWMTIPPKGTGRRD